MLKFFLLLSLIIHNLVFVFYADIFPHKQSLFAPKLPLENNFYVSLKSKNNNTTNFAKKHYYSEFEDNSNLINSVIEKTEKTEKSNKSTKKQIIKKISNKNSIKISKNKKSAKKNNQNLVENIASPKNSNENSNKNSNENNNNNANNNSTIIYTPPQWENVAYLHNPTPEYPEISQQRGEQGTVKIKAVISESGSVINAEIWQSSKFSRLDSKALETIKKWKFIPARSNQKNVQTEVIIPIRFILNNV